ncbi:PilZ domain-containing protein [Novosphingobium soli]|uniref:PilZ domain-containing protein n=1 Tax=Novosphingobium soli TaxID=574956 RepID=A0ABV6CYL9_9SPHN
MIATRSRHPAHASAVARHVSAEGCQFVVEQGNVAEGQSLGLAVDGHPPIRGTVRWVVSDRIGFAFDCPLPRDAQAALQQRGRSARTVSLYLA